METLFLQQILEATERESIDDPKISEISKSTLGPYFEIFWLAPSLLKFKIPNNVHLIYWVTYNNQTTTIYPIHFEVIILQWFTLLGSQLLRCSLINQEIYLEILALISFLHSWCIMVNVHHFVFVLPEVSYISKQNTWYYSNATCIYIYIYIWLTGNQENIYVRRIKSIYTLPTNLCWKSCLVWY